jgi:hypothetical protein
MLFNEIFVIFLFKNCENFIDIFFVCLGGFCCKYSLA